MNRRVLGKIGSIGLLLVIVFGVIHYLGGYLIEQISRFDEAAPSIEENITQEQVIKRLVLRLEPVSYYTIQLGSFTDAAEGQAVIGLLADQGYRVYVKQGPPYKLFLGCFGQKNEQSVIPEAIRSAGQDVYIEEALLNTSALKFAENDPLMQEKIAPLIGEYDVVIKHSLKMFATPFYSQYSDEIWQQMLSQLNQEVTDLIKKSGDILTDESSKAIAKSLINLEEVTDNYLQSLQTITEKKNDKVVFLAQSYLLQLIVSYHQFIDEVNQINEKQ